MEGSASGFIELDATRSAALRTDLSGQSPRWEVPCGAYPVPPGSPASPEDIAADLFLERKADFQLEHQPCACVGWVARSHPPLANCKRSCVLVRSEERSSAPGVHHYSPALRFARGGARVLSKPALALSQSWSPDSQTAAGSRIAAAVGSQLSGKPRRDQAGQKWPDRSDRNLRLPARYRQLLSRPTVSTRPAAPRP